MSELKYYCPKCESFWYFEQRKRYVQDHFGYTHAITYHPVPQDCFKCQNRFMEVVSQQEIKEYGLGRKEASSW